MSVLWRACSIMLMPLMEILVDGIHLRSLIWITCSMNVPLQPNTSHPAVVRSASREETTSKVKREKMFENVFLIWLLAFKV